MEGHFSETTPPAPTPGPVAPIAEPTAEALQERDDRIAELEAELAAAQQPDVVAAEPKQPVAASPSATDAPTAIVESAPGADHTLSPGSAGAEVTKLAYLLEALGEETYLRAGENPAHVFDDALMASVRRVLSRHAQATGDPSELATTLRNVASMDVVDAEVWAALRAIGEEVVAV